MMHIQFVLAWLNSTKNTKAAFKHASAASLFNEYTERIGQFTVCEIHSGDVLRGVSGKSGKTKALAKPEASALWLCDRGSGSKILSSEDVARELARLQDGGKRNLRIGIGGPDGFSKDEIAELKPELRWCYGPLTLPHELAAIVAAEQIYRAWTILKKMPYHGGH